MNDDLDPLDELRADVNELNAAHERAKRRVVICNWFALPAVGGVAATFLIPKWLPSGWALLLHAIGVAIPPVHMLIHSCLKSTAERKTEAYETLQRRLDILEQPHEPVERSPEDKQLVADVQHAWREAAGELGIEVVAPVRYYGVESSLLIRDFGSPHGTMPVLPGDAAHLIDIARDMGVNVVTIDLDAFRRYDRTLFTRTLRSWGWHGRDDPPSWYFEFLDRWK